uniref:Uncharacterized protein n=1 Tax=Arundo donax TaxID=35708 RepID=A0A0A9EXS1_ARUDO
MSTIISAKSGNVIHSPVHATFKLVNLSLLNHGVNECCSCVTMTLLRL